MTTPQADAASATLFLEGELNIYRALELKDTMLSALQGAATLEVDLAGVTEIDTAGMQILMLTKQTARATNKEVRLGGHSPAVLDAIQLLDLGAYFGDPLLI